MKYLIVLALLGSACSHSPLTPAPTTITLAGTVTATNGGQPLASASIDVAGQHVITDAVGTYRVEVPSGRYTLMISGQGLLPRTLAVDVQGPRTQALEAITQSGGFDLTFYRQLVRNSLEAPLGAVRIWPECCPTFSGSVILFTVDTADETGAAVDPAFLAMARESITTNTPIWTAGRYTASFGASGVPVRWLRATNGTCGENVGNYEIDVHIRASSACPSVRTLLGHELGHLFGFYHTDSPSDLMYGHGSQATEPNARERYHAAIAYRRPVGNRDPDSDP